MAARTRSAANTVTAGDVPDTNLPAKGETVAADTTNAETNAFAEFRSQIVEEVREALSVFNNAWEQTLAQQDGAISMVNQKVDEALTSLGEAITDLNLLVSQPSGSVRFLDLEEVGGDEDDAEPYIPTSNDDDGEWYTPPYLQD